MIITALLAAISIAFPKEGQILPPVEKCYVIGATDETETPLEVRGEMIPVYRTGAWATMIDVVPGVNKLLVGTAVRTFTVERKKEEPSETKRTAVAPKVYPKLPYAADVPQAPKGVRTPSEITVVLDPGHGGKEDGAISPHGRKEKEANLLLAEEIMLALKERGFKVLMTRTDDTTVELYDRPKLAHEKGAEAFISIHHNAPPCNKNPLTLRYHAVYAWNGIGEELAKAINGRMAAAVGSALANNGVLHANFAVTRNPEIPSCLIEADFVTSPEGEESIWNQEIRERTAAAIAEGFLDWCRQTKRII